MADGDREVLSSLPRTRPERRSAKRGARTPAGAAAANVKAATPSKPKSKPRPKAKAAPPREVPPAGYAVPKTASPVGSGPTELVGTAIQALGELANLGASLGSRALRDALGRLPKA